MAAVAHGESRVENCHRFLRISRCSRLPHGYMAGEMPLPFSMVCWNPCYFGRLCQENGTFAEILWMVEPFVFSANRGNAKHQFRSLPSVSVLSSAFARHTISSFRAFAVSKTYEIVWRSRGRSFSGHEGAGASFFARHVRNAALHGIISPFV